MDNTKKTDIKDLEYTIVMDASYVGPDPDEVWSPQNAEVDALYASYEKMCLREPTVIDKDDAYPHTYYWRMGDRYDPGKVEVLKAALEQGKKIADTDEYQKYVEDMKNSKFKPESWD